MNRIKFIVYTSDLDLSDYFPDYKGEVIPVLDSRSAVYIATGIAAQNKETVIVLLKSSNASRSAFSGMTEAYYRNLPVILITIGRQLDYSNELNDAVNSHCVISSIEEISHLTERSMPIHAELNFPQKAYEKKSCSIFDSLKLAVEVDDYLYVSQNILFDIKDFKCKVVIGGTANCLEGALSNVLGASLAKKKRRYIGVVVEEEFLHDINTLGNINVNDSLVYIVLCNQNNELIGNYARTLGFFVSCFNGYEIHEENIRTILNNKNKSLIIVNGE